MYKLPVCWIFLVPRIQKKNIKKTKPFWFQPTFNESQTIKHKQQEQEQEQEQEHKPTNTQTHGQPKYICIMLCCTKKYNTCDFLFAIVLFDIFMFVQATKSSSHNDGIKRKAFFPFPLVNVNRCMYMQIARSHSEYMCQPILPDTVFARYQFFQVQIY